MPLTHKKDPAADFLPEMGVEELLAQDLDDLPAERAMLRALPLAQSVREVLLVNGREPGSLRAACQAKTRARASSVGRDRAVKRPLPGVRAARPSD